MTSLVRRVEALETKARKAAPQRRNQLLEMSITAMVWAWTPEEVELMLAAAEGSKLDQLPADLRRRWVRSLDFISVQRFGKSFGALLASPVASGEMPEGPQPSLATLIRQDPLYERK